MCLLATLPGLWRARAVAVGWAERGRGRRPARGQGAAQRLGPGTRVCVCACACSRAVRSRPARRPEASWGSPVPAAPRSAAQCGGHIPRVASWLAQRTRSAPYRADAHVARGDAHVSARTLGFGSVSEPGPCVTLSASQVGPGFGCRVAAQDSRLPPCTLRGQGGWRRAAHTGGVGGPSGGVTPKPHGKARGQPRARLGSSPDKELSALASSRRRPRAAAKRGGRGRTWG